VTTIRLLLLVDACVLIDYATTSGDVLQLVSKHVGSLHVTPTVFTEVTQMPPGDVARWGLTVVEPSLEALGWASQERGRLSFPDRLAIAVSKEHGFTCVSNDRQLRLECDRQGVSVIWGLELLIQLVEAHGIPVAKAEACGKAICAANRWLGSNVLEGFLLRLQKLGGHRTRKLTPLPR
jgi:hypothetical protein